MIFQVFLDIVESVNLLMSQKGECVEFSDILVVISIDGIGLCRNGSGRISVLLNEEGSKV